MTFRSFAVAFVFLSSACGYAYGQQALPGPVPPPLRDEQRAKVQIVSASAAGSPIHASGYVMLGPTTSGEGLLTLKNVGNKPVISIRGFISYQTSAGSKSFPWTMGFDGRVLGSKRYFASGESASVPPFQINVTKPPHKVYGVEAMVTGVLFSDGTTWGPAGESLKKRFLDRVAADRFDLEQKVLPVFEQFSREDCEREIKNGIIGRGNSWLNGFLKKALLDQNGNLVPDAHQRLKNILANMQDPFNRPASD